MGSSNSISGDKKKATDKFVPDENNFLQKHVFFFDANQDGIVYPWETYTGFRAIGSGILLSTLAGVLMNVSLSQKTRPGKFPSLLFPIEIQNIQRGKHGSDTGVYDTQGRFCPDKFEEIFTEHAHTYPNALTSGELYQLIRSDRQPDDFTGWLTAWSEWRLAYWLCKDKNGLLQKDTVRGIYDGTTFEKMAKERELAKKA